MPRRERSLAEQTYDDAYLDPRTLERWARDCDHPEFTMDHRAVPLYGARLRQSMMRAERFALDDDFVRRATSLALSADGVRARVDPDAVSRALTLARAPFPVTWVEWDCRAMLEERVRLGLMHELADDAPRTVGVLIEAADDDADHWCMRTFVRGGRDGTWPAIIAFEVCTDPAEELPVRHDGLPGGDRMMMDSVHHRCDALFGSYEVKLRGGLARPAARFARHQAIRRVRMVPDLLSYSVLFSRALDATHPRDDQAVVDVEIKESRGMLRFVLSALALINASVIEYHYEAAPAGRRRGRTIPRAWIPAHQRGDASLGFVRQDHEVTAS